MHMQPATAVAPAALCPDGAVLDLDFFEKLVKQKMAEAEQRQTSIRQKLETSSQFFGLTHAADFNPPITETDKWALKNAAKVIQRCREALDRIQRGIYGICITCREPIDERRLKAIPFTPKCIGCKSPADDI